MTKAEELFRTYFECDEDYVMFKYRYRVEAVDDPPHGHAVCTRTDPKSHPQSYEGKPALVVISSKGQKSSAVEWRRGKLLHRTDGPAQIITYTDGRVFRNWYVNGVRTAGPK